MKFKLENWWLFIFMLVLVVTIFSSPVLASDSDDDPHHGDSSITDVDTIVRGDSTRLFSVGGSDMEISGCLATFSWLFGVKQGAKIDPDCETVKEAARLDAQGHHLTAAKMRCSTKLYRKVLGKGQPCIDAVQVVPRISRRRKITMFGMLCSKRRSNTCVRTTPRLWVAWRR